MMDVTIGQLCNLFKDVETQEIELYSLDDKTIIWSGYADECIEIYEDLTVISIENLGGIDKFGNIKAALVINV